MGAERQRSYSWSDNAEALRFIGGASGLEFCEKSIERGWVLPIWATLGIRMTHASPGAAVVEFTPDAFHCNPVGVVHGGVLATALDSAASAAVHTTLPAGASYATLDLNVHYTRPAVLDGRAVACRGRVLHAARRVVLAEAEARNADDELLAHATAALRVTSGASPGPEPEPAAPTGRSAERS